ncbi:hypothetical protein KEJ39_01595 [Candidatus Bathyarchaeota archaeon]|nr:hypothetical protein [Candidatus Bathyarchaeota archaeon]
MVRLNEQRISWVIHEKLGGAGELALIQRVSRRMVEQLWQAQGDLRQLGRRHPHIGSHDRLKADVLTLESVLKYAYGVNLPHNRIHMVLE